MNEFKKKFTIAESMLPLTSGRLPTSAFHAERNDGHWWVLSNTRLAPRDVLDNDVRCYRVKVFPIMSFPRIDLVGFHVARGPQLGFPKHKSSSGDDQEGPGKLPARGRYQLK